MSHLSICKVKIRNPNAEILKLAVMQIAQQSGGRIVSTKDVYGLYRETAEGIIIAIRTPELPMGVAVRIKNGEVEILGDFYGRERERRKFENELVKTYTSMAIAKVLQAMGYSVNVQKAKEKVMLIAQSHS